MALTKTRTLDKIEIVGSFKYLQARFQTKVLENGVQIASSYERETYNPDTEISDLPEELRGYAVEAWTQNVIDAYIESLPKE